MEHESLLDGRKGQIIIERDFLNATGQRDFIVSTTSIPNKNLMGTK